jgi:hypothetical protein
MHGFDLCYYSLVVLSILFAPFDFDTYCFAYEPHFEADKFYFAWFVFLTWGR